MSIKSWSQKVTCRCLLSVLVLRLLRNDFIEGYLVFQTHL